MARNPTFPLFDRLLDGKLAELIHEGRAAGLSPAEVRDDLRDNHEVTVSVETVRRWIRDLEAASPTETSTP